MVSELPLIQISFRQLRPDEVRVRCGDWDLLEDLELWEPQDRDVESFSRHPAYNGNQLWNDIALIHVDTDFVLHNADGSNPNVDRICLPKVGADLDHEVNNCVVTGWGERAEDYVKADDNGPAEQPIMKAVHNLPIVDHEECEKDIKADLSRFRLHESFVCAGGQPGVDACSGDGGGPLACPQEQDKDTYTLAGVVVGGIGCGSDIPGAYASIEYNLCFIHWATKCKDGARYSDYYWESACDDWMNELKPTLKRSREKEAAKVLEDSCI